MTTNQLIHVRKRTRTAWTFATAAITTLGLTIASARAQARILWLKQPISSAAKDVATTGRLCVAANLGPETCERVVNGVHFQQDRSFWRQKARFVGATTTQSTQYFPPIVATSGGYTLKAPYNRTAGGIGPRHSAPAYGAILKDGRHRSGSVTSTVRAITCSVEGLKPGNSYMIQIWCGNKGRNTRHHEWDNGQGGRGTAAGGIYLKSNGSTFGEVATGIFKADSSGSQTFTNYHQAADANATPPILETWGACSAIQVRDLTVNNTAARATFYGEGTPGTQSGGQSSSGNFKRVGGTNCSPGFSLSGHPKMSAKLNLTCENTSGVTNNGLIVLGLKPLSFPFLGGQLLVDGVVFIAVTVPFDNTPNRVYTHAHELVVPVTMPSTIAAFYVQVLQIDPKAAGGVAFTAGMKIEVGL